MKISMCTSAQTWFVIIGGLWWVSDSSPGESRSFQTCSKPYQTRFSYLPAFLGLSNLQHPWKPVNIYVSVDIRFRPWEHRSNSTFICDLPLTCCLTEAAGQAFGNQMSGWVLRAGWGCMQLHMWAARPMPVHPLASDFTLAWQSWGERVCAMNICVLWNL